MKAQATKARSWAATDTGRVREHNEDNLFVDDKLGLYVVADGVGGAVGGQVASRAVVETVMGAATSIKQLVTDTRTSADPGAARRAVFDALHRLIQDANSKIYRRAQEDSSLKGMATTTSLILLARGEAYVAHVGDSRIYLFREGEASQITADHTWAQELVQKGELAPEDVPNFRYKNVIVRSVGGSAAVRPDLVHITTSPGDTFLLCSDGLTDYALEEDIFQTLRDWGPGGSAPRLVELANRGGGGDNVTVILAHVGEDREVADPALHEAPTTPLAHTHKIEFLHQRFIFQHLSRDELLKVLRYVYDEEAQPGERIVRQGESGRDIFFIVDGSVEVFVNDVQVARVGAGGHFGEMALISGEQRSATVAAGEYTRLLRMSQADFYDLTQKDPGIAVKMLWAFLQTTSERVKQLSTEVAGRR